MAETCYRYAAENGGKGSVMALLRMAKALSARGAFQEGLKVCLEAVRIDPANAAAWCAQGVAHRQLAQLEEARRCYDRALEIDPANLYALSNIGELHLLRGDPVTALSYFESVLERSPLFYEALGNRIAALIKCDRLVEAEQVARQATDHYPESAGFQNNLASVLITCGKKKPALSAIQKALQIEPGNQEALLNLAMVKGDTEVLKNSVAFIRRRIELEGESPFLWVFLAMALRSSEQFAEAEVVCHRLLERHPHNVLGWVTLSHCVGAMGDVARAMEYSRKALELAPELAEILSNIVFDSTYLGELTAQTLFELHLEWAQRYETPLLGKQYSHQVGTEPEKRLRIGYVSGDCRNHPVGSLLLSVLRQHDHQKFEIHCFSTFDFSDDVTTMMRAQCDRWHDVELLSVEELAELVIAQQIDILLDLSGHSAFNRLRLFALKPAPVQATWIGYFHSTGLSSIDYFISDPYTTPAGSSQLFSEIPARLPHSRFCYTAPEFAPPVVKPAFETLGSITFGSFNRLAKLTDPVIQAWVRIVMGVEDARLLIKARELSEPEMAQRIRDKFESYGLPPQRLILRPASGHPQMLQEYAEVDIALDPFPFNGGMTTLESLWMGVPVLALVGNSVVSRQSTSMLSNIGLEELLFDDVESYVAGALALAHDRPRITALRRAIRPKMRRSPLCDAQQFTQDLELMYRRMWQAWCRGERLGSEIVPSAQITRRTVLHVGCGPADIRSLPTYFQKGWQEIRLDIDPDAHPDILGTALDMSAVPSGSVAAVYSSHMLEHIYAHELPIALAEMKRVLKSDGILVATVPDLQTVARLIVEDQLLNTAYESAAGPITPFDMVYGHRGYMGGGKLYMAHRGGFTLTTMIASLKEAGFAAATGKRREAAFDLWALAAPEPMTEDQLKQLAAEVLPN